MLIFNVRIEKSRNRIPDYNKIVFKLVLSGQNYNENRFSA